MCSSGDMNQYAFCCADRFLVTQAGLSRHICIQHVCCICHLWSSALTVKNIPGSDSHTLTDVQPRRCTTKHRHSYSQLVLAKCFPLTGQFVWFLLLFHCVWIAVLECYTANMLCVINKSFICSSSKFGSLWFDLLHKSQPIVKVTVKKEDMMLFGI